MGKKAFFFNIKSDVLIATFVFLNGLHASEINCKFHAGKFEQKKDRFDFDEFLSREDSPTHEIGSDNLLTIRSWIGNSECATCGNIKSQSFRFDLLEPGKEYSLIIYPSYVSSSEKYIANSTNGESITYGKEIAFTAGYKNKGDFWLIKFRALSNSEIITISGTQNRGNHYMYLDFVTFDTYKTKTTLSKCAKVFDNKNNNGNWYKDNIFTLSGQHIWNQAYVMDSYLSLFETTRDSYWIAKFFDHATSVLAQRDFLNSRRDYRGRLSPAWQEIKTKNVWVGYTGALFQPLLRFARMVNQDSSLSKHKENGTSYVNHATNFVRAFEDALAFHLPDWRYFNSYSGTFYFPEDFLVDVSLRAKAVPVNMSALMMESILEYKKILSIVSPESIKLQMAQKIVSAYDSYLLVSVIKKMDPTVCLDCAIWNYSSYYSEAEDIGHGNFLSKYIMRSYKLGETFNFNALKILKNTFNFFIDPIGTSIGQRINRGHVQGVSVSTFYWRQLAGLSAQTKSKATLSLIRSNYSFLDFVSAATEMEGN